MFRLALIAALAAGMLTSAANTVRAADYVTIRKEVEVDAPADAVWARVGGYCAIADWMKTTCEYVSGAGGVGTVRRILNGTVLEAMVAQTPRSYTYWQTQGNMAVAAYHGTLAAEPLERGRTRLIYILFYDQAAFPSDEVRKAQHERLEGRFQGFLEVMKAMTERPGDERPRKSGKP
jgi:hypothetical protein